MACSGRVPHQLRAYSTVQDVEGSVEEYYRRIQIPEHIIVALCSFITAQFAQLHATVQQERNAHVLERHDRQASRSKLLQAPYAGRRCRLILLKSEQDHIGRRLRTRVGKRPR